MRAATGHRAPNAILNRIGREGGALALSAASMGTLVFGTLHTNSAHKTIDRIIDVFPSDQQA